MPPLKRPKSSVPWSQLRKMKKEERLLIKKENQEKDEISPLNKSVVTGINAVTRGLERKDLCSVLLDANVESIVVKHIITMAENENIPAVLIPFLKVVTLETIGFGSAAFALKVRTYYRYLLDFCLNYFKLKVLTIQIFKLKACQITNWPLNIPYLRKKHFCSDVKCAIQIIFFLE